MNEQQWPTPANHPQSCYRCSGSGWEEADPIKTRTRDGDIEYTTVKPCTYRWHQDDPHDPPITLGEYLTRLRAREDRGDTAATVELDAWTRYLGTPSRSAQ